MRIYLAARYSRRDELRGHRERLESLGHVVASRWLDGEYPTDREGYSLEAPTTYRHRYATEDLSDVLSADMCISFTEEPRAKASRGGRHVEFGAALGRGNIRLVVIGPRENVFHCLEVVQHYGSFDEFLDSVDGKWLYGNND